MRRDPINLRDKLARFSDQWAPKVIAELNDYQFKLVKLEGEFVWHSHGDTDEAFIVIDAPHGDRVPRRPRVELGPGEMYVVPKGVEHRPVAARECHVMLVEPRGVVNTGDAGGAYTAPNDVRI
jgi:mannose-6-phosphate isomerase-like protein (cupin superfamily)